MKRIFFYLALCGLCGSCVPLTKKDAFPVAGKVLGVPSLQALAGPDSQVLPLEVSANGHPVTAYYIRHPRARGVLLFVGGSGNQVDAAVQVLAPRTAARGLDLAVLSYYQAGETVPSVGQVRAEVQAVYAAVKETRLPAARSVYIMGHSLGGWFALDVAAHEKVSGLALVGAETTQAEVIRRIYSPWSHFLFIRPDEDTKQLDAARYASRVRAPTLVVTSHQDEAVPATVGQELYALLPAATPKRLVVLDRVSHGRYFLSDDFWRQFDAFFR